MEAVEDPECHDTACPYCGAVDSCDHLLLVVDQTFRSAEGGALYEVFGNRWSAMSDSDESDFNEGEAFSELTEQVDSLADASSEYGFEGGPGMSSTYTAYYCSSAERMNEALRRFQESAAE